MSLGVNSGVPPPTQKFQSFCQEIASCVFIPVENTSTLASMSSFRQGFFNNLMTGTTFLTAVLRWNGNNNFAKHLPIVLQPGKKLSPCSIANTFGKTTILDHVTHLQRLKHHQIVRFDHASCQFNSKIFTLARDFQVFSSQLINRLEALIRAFNLATYSSLKTLESLFRLSQMTRIFNFVPLIVGVEMHQPNIKSNHLLSWFDLFKSRSMATQN